jgi:galactitol-specific phosphotransferase system IIB component
LAHYAPAIIRPAIGNGEARKHGIGIFAAVKVKPASLTETIDNRSANHRRVVRVRSADGNGLSQKVDIAVSHANVRTGLDFNGIAVICIVDSGLDSEEIRRAVIVNSNYSGLRDRNPRQNCQNSNQSPHFCCLL